MKFKGRRALFIGAEYVLLDSSLYGYTRVGATQKTGYTQGR